MNKNHDSINHISTTVCRGLLRALNRTLLTRLGKTGPKIAKATVNGILNSIYLPLEKTNFLKADKEPSVGFK